MATMIDARVQYRAVAWQLRNTGLVHVLTEIYELPFLHVYGTNFKWWQRITAVLPGCSSQDHFHPHIGDLVYLELEVKNAVPHSVQCATSKKQCWVLPIFAYVKYIIKDTLTESTRVHKKVCEYCMLLTLLSRTENVCAFYKVWIHSEWMYSSVNVCHWFKLIKQSCTLESICSLKHTWMFEMPIIRI
jgi:hypothetical protein